MSYNDTSQEFLDSLTKENCPSRWIEEAKMWKLNKEVTTSEDMERLYRHILRYILEDEQTTSKKTETVEEFNEEEARNLRVHTKVADEYGDMKEQSGEEE